MAQKFKRKINVTACTVGYQGMGSNNKPFTIYDIVATAEDGAPLQVKLKCFAQLPLGLAEYEIEPYLKNGQVDSYTIIAPKGSQSNALDQRVQFLEDQMKWVMERLSSGATPPPPGADPLAPQPPAAQDLGGGFAGVPSAYSTSDDDIPF